MQCHTGTIKFIILREFYVSIFSIKELDETFVVLCVPLLDDFYRSSQTDIDKILNSI